MAGSVGCGLPGEIYAVSRLVVRKRTALIFVSAVAVDEDVPAERFLVFSCIADVSSGSLFTNDKSMMIQRHRSSRVVPRPFGLGEEPAGRLRSAAANRDAAIVESVATLARFGSLVDFTTSRHGQKLFATARPKPIDGRVKVQHGIWAAGDEARTRARTYLCGAVIAHGSIDGGKFAPMYE
ncbi:hypothetical protein UVI_02050920 [Ustilaginoidea virens]|uniref:Uncharacterized protein n=1 Tax=Ustilaginoidea virens TaxID=1159556 RepID=A0A1B5L2C6_USTVR|nr:hypothetical protein UVI_02050920 [Ustilaginoidea virens]